MIFARRRKTMVDMFRASVCTETHTLVTRTAMSDGRRRLGEGQPNLIASHLARQTPLATDWGACSVLNRQRPEHRPS